MAVQERQVVQQVVICDLCDAEADGNATKINANATGYIKRDHFEFDVCDTCAARLGLHRRGRPATRNVPPVLTAPAPRARRQPLAVPADSWEG